MVYAFVLVFRVGVLFTGMIELEGLGVVTKSFMGREIVDICEPAGAVGTRIKTIHKNEDGFFAFG